MPYYEKEQIARAREMDLLTYLQRYEPDELIHDGGGSYRRLSKMNLLLYAFGLLPVTMTVLKSPTACGAGGRAGSVAVPPWIISLRYAAWTSPKPWGASCETSQFLSRHSHAPLRHGQRRKPLSCRNETITTAACSPTCVRAESTRKSSTTASSMASSMRTVNTTTPYSSVSMAINPGVPPCEARYRIPRSCETRKAVTSGSHSVSQLQIAMALSL